LNQSHLHQAILVLFVTAIVAFGMLRSFLPLGVRQYLAALFM